MTLKNTQFRFQRQQSSTTSGHCCVPGCTRSAKFNSLLSFFTIPKDVELRKKWFINIRRDDLIGKETARVCSRHFSPADVKEPCTVQGRRLLRRGAVPSLFEWNNFSPVAPCSNVWEQEQKDTSSNDQDDLPVEMETCCSDNVCRALPEPAAVDLVKPENTELIVEKAFSSKFDLRPFAGSNEYIRFNSSSQIAKKNPYCVIVGCSNSTYHLNRWKSKVCTLHGCNRSTGSCICEPPFKLHPFPSDKPKDSNLRQKWIQAVKRVVFVNQKWVNWVPRKESRICSKHFVDLDPSSANPIPTLNLGRTSQGFGNIRPRPKKRGSNSNEQKNNKKCKDEAQSCADVLPAKERSPENRELPESFSTDKQTEFSSAGLLPVNHDHSYYIKHPNETQCECESCIIRVHQIDTLKKPNEALKDDFDKLQDQMPKNSIASSLLTSDAKVSFYTGLPNKETFYAIFSQIEPRAQKLQYWQDVKDMTLFTVHKYRIFPKKPGAVKKLPLVDDYFLTLMKLRLNLCMEDLGERFGLTAARCSQVFKTWIKFLRTELESLVFFPEREIIQANMPKAFREQASKVHVIIDCSNVYIEKSNKLKGHCHTDSDNKKAIRKFLVGITLQGHIAYMSKAWSGITSDNHIIRHSGILNYLEPGDQVMADRKFSFEKELLQRHATLVIPPSNDQEQMTRQGLASLRIHVERAIDRIKWFRILKSAMPFRMLPLLDDIIIVCGALCNLLPSLAES